MKRILYIVFVLISSKVQARDYYVSASGNNNNNGLSTTTAWQTIGKVNSFSFAANDRILFRRGDTFYGGLIVKRSSLSFGAYGSGSNPVITGLTTVSGWVNSGGNTWEAPVTNVKSGVNLVLRNSTIQQVGRYPNADAENGGYLTYTASTNTSITGPAHSSTTNWTGAEVVIKVNRWSIARQRVTSHSGGVVHFTTNPDIPRLNYGYFFQRDSRTLDRDGEWWHNVSGNKLRMYFSSNNPGSYTIQIATVDTLFRCQYYNNITISDLSFNGSGKRSICINGGSSITVRNCDVSNSGAEAIVVKGSLNVTVDNCTATNSLGGGISVSNPNDGTVNSLVQNCTVLNTSYIAGMETSNEGMGGEGINCMGGDGVSVLHNSVTNSGYNGIKWQGNDVYIKYNLVDRFCVLRDDGAGIYSWESAAARAATRVNRNIISNIVINGIGSNEGTNNSTTSVQGLYFDLGSKNVIVDSNTVAYITNGAFHGNNCASLTITNNVFFGNLRSASLQRFADADLIRKIIIKKNIMFPYLFRYINLGINSPATTKEADMLAMGTIDSNYYSLGPIPDRSLATTTTNDDNSDYKEEYFEFSYLTGTIGIEKHSSKIVATGTLEYNAGSSPRVVSFSGLSRKDVFGNVYNNSVTIPAWSSKVLLPNGSASTTNKAPVANAGTGKTITLPINTVTLTGTGTDSDGTITKYSWAKISGPSTGSIATPLAASTLLLNLVAGVYQYALTVTDDDGSTGNDTVQVTVNPLIGNNLLPAVNPSNTVNGLDYKYYEGSWLVLPSFPTLTAVNEGIVLNFDLGPAGMATNYGFSFTGFINVPADGMYTFYTSSEDGSNLYIDNVLTVSNDGIHAATENSGVIGLRAGKHTITVLYFQNGGTGALNVSYEGSGVPKQAIPASALYRVNTLLPAVNPANAVNGLNYKYYEGSWLVLPNFPVLTPVETGTVTNFDLSPAYVSLNYGFSFTGYIDVPADGVYTFYTNSDDGSELYIDDVMVVSNDGLHGPNEESGVIGLKAGKHTIAVQFFQRGGGGSIVVSYAGNGISKQVIPSSALYKVNPLLPAVDLSNAVSGLDYKYYEGSWLVLPSFSTLDPLKTGTVSNFDLSPAEVVTNYGFSFTGYIDVPTDGVYTFYTKSDDGSSLYIDDVLVVSNDGLHGPTEISGVIGLMGGKHTITALFFQRGGGGSLVVSYEGNGISKQVIPSSALYRINPLLPAVNPANTVNGLDYKYYEGSWLELPSFSSLTPVETGTVPNFSLSPANISLNFGFSFTGYINVPSDGMYTFYTNSDDGSNLFIDNVQVVSNDGLHGPTEESGVIGLMAGKHAITGLYFQRGGGSVFTVSYEGDGISKRTIPSSALYRVNFAAPPVSATRSINGIMVGSGNMQNITNTINELKITSFPNPSSTEFNLALEGEGDNKVEIRVTDSHGRTVFNTTGTTRKSYRFGYNFMPGLYIIKVIQGNKIQTFKVIKITKPA